VSAGIRPEHIVQAPKNILASAVPQPNGTMWVLAGSAESRGLFELDPTSGKVLGSISVSSAARSGMPPRQRPAEALEALARQIPGPGLFYICSDGVLGVLSLPAVSVWSNGRGAVMAGRRR
jgi:hypothetical protein